MRSRFWIAGGLSGALMSAGASTLLSVAMTSDLTAQMMVAGISDTAIVAAALDHVANTVPGRVLYLDPRKLNPMERTGPNQWLSDWRPELLRALRLDYRLIKGAVMTNGAQSCKPTHAVDVYTPSVVQRGSAQPLKPRIEPMMGMSAPTTVYVAAAMPEVSGDSAHVLVSVCENGRFAERELLLVHEPRKWKVRSDEVQRRN